MWHFFLAGFAISTARSTIPAITIFFSYFLYDYLSANNCKEESKVKFFISLIRVSLFKIPREIYNWIIALNFRHKLFFFTSITAIILMLAIGSSVENTFRAKNFVKDFIRDSWGVALLSTATIYPIIQIKVNAFNPSSLMYGFWCLIVLAFSLPVRIIVVKGQIKIKALMISVAIATVILMLFFSSKIFYPAIYVLSLIVFFLSFVGRITTLQKFLVWGFTFASIFQLFIFNGQFSVPNFAQFEWLTWFFVASGLCQIDFRKVNIFSKTLLTVAIAGCATYLYIAPIPLSPLGLFLQNSKDDNSISLPFNLGDRTASYYRNIEPVCYLGSPKISALASLGGARAYYSTLKNFNTSVSSSFLIPKEETIINIINTCRDEKN